jgi:hypothetical protein
MEGFTPAREMPVPPGRSSRRASHHAVQPKQFPVVRACERLIHPLPQNSLVKFLAFGILRLAGPFGRLSSPDAGESKA